MNKYEFFWYNLRCQYREFWFIFCAFNRQAELTHLIKWAQQKGLRNPLRLYRNRLSYTEQVLFRAQIVTPGVTRCARILYQVKNLVFSPSKYHPKGSAKYYKHSWLTH